MRPLGLLLAGLLLGGVGLASAGSFTTTPEQDTTLAAIAAERGTTAHVVLSTTLDNLTTSRARQQQIREIQAVRQACAKGDQQACAAISKAAKDVKK